MYSTVVKCDGSEPLTSRQIKVFSQLSQLKILKISSLMTPQPLDILKKGFAKLIQTITKKRDDLNIKLSQQEDISSADEQWLDNKGNTIDKQHILEKLESASDYKTGVAQLDDNGKAIMKKLQELAGDPDLPAKVAGKKRKHHGMHLFLDLRITLLISLHRTNTYI